MNILHMKYAVEVARLGSLNKAADSLLVAQPNVSRSIKELESDLGITIFNRSVKGMSLTLEGERFIRYAQGILEQIERVENVYKKQSPKKQRLSVSVPRACYISEAFTEFSKSLGEEAAEIFYVETNSRQTLQNVMENFYKLGIIRYAEGDDRACREMLEEKGLCCELVGEFSYSLIMSRRHPLADKPEITFTDLAPYIEIAHTDPFVSDSVPLRSMREELPEITDRRIFIYERASQFDLLRENPETFMWVSPISGEVLDRYDLICRGCAENQIRYKDVLIYREGYRLNRQDRAFITALCNSRRRNFR